MKCVDCGRRITLGEALFAWRLPGEYRCLPTCEGEPDADRWGMVAFLAAAVGFCLWLVT